MIGQRHRRLLLGNGRERLLIHGAERKLRSSSGGAFARPVELRNRRRNDTQARYVNSKRSPDERSDIRGFNSRRSRMSLRSCGLQYQCP